MRATTGRRVFALALAVAVATTGPPAVTGAQDERPDLKIEVVGPNPNDPRRVVVRATNLGRSWADATTATVETIPATVGA